jgi:hypothetical protein
LPDLRPVIGLFEASGDLAAAQPFVGELAGQSDDLLFSFIRYQLLALRPPTERRPASRVATRDELGCPTGGHPRPDEGTLVQGDGAEQPWPCSTRTPSTLNVGPCPWSTGQPNEKQVGDKGIDGRIRFHADKDKISTIIVSVKGGQHITPALVH